MRISENTHYGVLKPQMRVQDPKDSSSLHRTQFLIVLSPICYFFPSDFKPEVDPKYTFPIAHFELK